jgi:hypothetical protein
MNNALKFSSWKNQKSSFRKILEKVHLMERIRNELQLSATGLFQNSYSETN